MNAQYLYLASVIIIAFLFPLYILLNGNKTKESLLNGIIKRVTVYKETIFLQLLLCLLIFFSMYQNNDSIDHIGLTFLTNPICILTLFIACSIGLLLMNKIKLNPKEIIKLELSLKDFSYLMPSTYLEYRWAIITAVFVGACEEIIFRGFLHSLIWSYLIIPLNNFIYLTTILTVLIVNFIFALSHYTTKFQNVISTFILGLIWSISFAITGSLWFAILTHILIDFYSSTLAIKYSTFQNHYNQPNK